MELCLLLPVCDRWDQARAWLDGLSEALAKAPDWRVKVWLIDDGSQQSPSSWNMLATDGLNLGVVELLGRHGRERAWASALGLLACEEETTEETFLLASLDLSPAEVPNLLDLALQHPGTILQPVCTAPAALSRSVCGRKPGAGTFLLVPANAAESLCHAPCFSVSPGAAVLQLGLPRRLVRTGSARVSLPEELAFVASLRDRAFPRLVRGAGALLLACLGSTAVLAMAGPPGAGWLALAVAAVAASGFAITVSLATAALATREQRPWTPALDGATVVKAVHRVRRAPIPVREAHA